MAATHALVFVALIAFAVLAAEGLTKEKRATAEEWAQFVVRFERLLAKGCANFCRNKGQETSDAKVNSSRYSCNCPEPLTPPEDSGTTVGEETPVVTDAPNGGEVTEGENGGEVTEGENGGEVTEGENGGEVTEGENTAGPVENC
ncbi:uncharacterized protein LOC135398320 [Ornithodoros turicata]|uniref:uncharacterized protein LOC135398320 n=1 Tax=Ornithodoros turicata TaxID=34597 RepID=UPI003138A23F